MRVRRATVADAEAISEIYNREVTETTATLDLVPRTVPEQRLWIQDRSGGLAVVVAEDGAEEVVGFASLSFYRDRPGYRTSVEDSVYVARGHQGAGIGSQLLSELIDVAAKHGFHAMFARIVGPQEASVVLHERHGFRLVGIEREVARKFGRWHDVAVMQLLL
jgi:phosphinothricin acetyltransferase